MRAKPGRGRNPEGSAPAAAVARLVALVGLQPAVEADRRLHRFHKPALRAKHPIRRALQYNQHITTYARGAGADSSVLYRIRSGLGAGADAPQDSFSA